jgi:leucyl-tRNA synthetase
MDYNHQEIETKWIKFWEEKEIYKTPDLDFNDDKFYYLDAFPYPSGSGLHVGHTEGFAGNDICARFSRMKGVKVMLPMGFDSFGLPAENYAIKTGLHPRINTDQAINNFQKQLRRVGFSYDWDREVQTHQPNYYKWTQWWFELLYKHGLAYKKEAMVNWDPVDKTVLANEQVLGDGTAERSGAKVEQIMMSQWFFKVTDFVEDKEITEGANKGKIRKGLLNGLDDLDWPEGTKQQQRNWIGRSEGAIVRFEVEGFEESIEVFTTRIDTIYSGTFVILAPEHHLVDLLTTEDQLVEVQNYQQKTKQKSALERTELNKEKTAAFTGSYCINPATGEKLPIWISDFVLGSYGTGAVFADAHDERDFELAKKYDIPLKTSIKPVDLQDDSKIRNLEECYSGYGILYNSDQFDGLESKEAISKIIDFGESQGWAKRKINYKLRDWLVSRQRYWGAPIPIIYKPLDNQAEPGQTDSDWSEELVPEVDLPVILPDDVEFAPTGRSPLIDHEAFHESVAQYGDGAKREVDTMDTFVCSSWYFFRYCSPHKTDGAMDFDEIKKWMPVDQYIIGAEHTVLHLLYARFFTKVLFDLGYIDFDEPFTRLRHPGIILSEDSRKMSKRWGNVINPDDVCSEFGGDTLRVYEMFMGPFDQSKPWNTNTVKGVKRFLDRVWRLQDMIVSEPNSSVDASLHFTIKKVTEDIPDLSFNTSVAEYMKFVNVVNQEGGLTLEQLKTFLKILAPFAPFITEEIWQTLHGYTDFKPEHSIHKQAWPEFDPSLIVEDEVTIVVQVNGKVRAEFVAAKDESEEALLERAKEEAGKWIEGKQIKFSKVIPGKMVTLAVK